ncbi:DUF397 domain-containing protein [Streptomyces sp. NPDC102467]|uniref:DUF397 domain-containing protein n=1 Tax=Streptomyces sp. NPDC102467 TaxID=3366179 RepID=UPI0037F89BA3
MRDPNWQKSSYCSEGNSCVHVSGDDTTHIRVTESADPREAILTATPAAFAALLHTLKKSTPHV